MFSDQTGQFPTCSQQGNKYIMVMVEIGSNAILVDPMKCHKDEEMIRTYNALLLQLKRAGILPKKHVLDNKVSENMKNHIHNTCKFEMELVPPGCHHGNAAKVAIHNLKPTSSASWPAYPAIFPQVYGICSSHKPRSRSTSSDNLMPPQMCWHTLTSVDHLTTTRCH